MTPTANVFLENVLTTIGRDVTPHTSGETRKLLQSGIPMSLQELLYRNGAGRGRIVEVYRELCGLADRFNGLLHAMSGPAIPPVATPDRTAANGADYETAVTLIDGLRGRLVAHAPAIAAARDDRSAGAQWRTAASDYLVALTRNELTEIVRDPPAPVAEDGVGDRIEAGRARLQARMAERLGKPDLEIVDHGRISGGFSKETFWVSARSGGETTPYIIRSGVIGGGYLDAIYQSLAQEFPILRWAWSHGVPAPQPYFYEEDETLIGSAFVLMERCAGAAVGNTMYAHDRVDIAVFPRLAKTLAHLHALPWRDHAELFAGVNGRTALTIAQSAQLFLDKNRRWMDSADLRPSPAITLALDWLSRNVPPNDGPAQFIHGDVGFHNMLIDGDRISALLDWEATSVGAPAWDLVAARLMLDERVSWETFAGWYVEAGGILPSDRELDYYLMMRALSGNLSCTIALEKMYAQTGYVGYLELGIMARPFYLQKFLDSAIALWPQYP